MPARSRFSLIFPENYGMKCASVEADYFGELGRDVLPVVDKTLALTTMQYFIPHSILD